MKKMILGAFILLFALAGIGLSGAQTTYIAQLVDSFENATDLQKNQVLADNLGKDISASGIIANVSEYDLFDSSSDIRGIYYQLTLEQQKTKNNFPYQVVFLFKDKDTIGNLNKGQGVQQNGKLVRILDERLQVSVWIFCGEFTDKDQALLNQDN